MWLQEVNNRGYYGKIIIGHFKKDIPDLEEVKKLFDIVNHIFVLYYEDEDDDVRIEKINSFLKKYGDDYFDITILGVDEPLKKYIWKNNLGYYICDKRGYHSWDIKEVISDDHEGLKVMVECNICGKELCLKGKWDGKCRGLK